MEEIKSRYSTRESFISELAFAMSNHDIQEEQYLNLTQQNLSVILREDYSWGKKWPAEGDEVIFCGQDSLMGGISSDGGV